jgi:hypothetical protein
VPVKDGLQVPCPYSHTIWGETDSPGHFIILPIRCRRWTCDHCFVANEIALKEKVISGNPERMLTFTAAPLRGESPIAMHRRIRPAISRTFQILRKLNGPLEAATFLELHRSGFPHYHALQRGAFIPWKLLRDTWQSLTGNYIVDIRAVREKNQAGKYVTKYVSKQFRDLVHKKLGRICNFTRGYLPKTQTTKAPSTIDWTYSKEHPATILAERFPGAKYAIHGNAIDVLTVGFSKPTPPNDWTDGRPLENQDADIPPDPLWL